MDNRTLLIVLMIVLIAFVVTLVALGLVFIIALRKRAPVIKVVMAPPAKNTDVQEAEEENEAAEENEEAEEPEIVASANQSAEEEQNAAPETVEYASDPETEEADDDAESASYITEGQERVRYDRSLTAKVSQLKNEAKEWYNELKNEILSYERMRGRMSWRRETFRLGRMTLARIVVRGKTLCLLLAVEPEGYAGTKYHVEDVSNVAASADTPTMYKIKSARRLKFAKEMVAGIMRELKIPKSRYHEAQDYFMPYEGDMSLMQRGLVKRVVMGSTRTFKIEEVDAAAAATQSSASAENTGTPEEAATAASASDNK